MKRFQIFLCSLILPFSLQGQESKESTKVDYIKSIQFLNQDIQQQYPIMKKQEVFTLVFDDLLAQDNDYYYKIRYFNKDWTESTLFKNDYLGGFDNQRIVDFQSSFGTLQRYNHYSLSLPNENTQFLISGNYMIDIFNQYDELMFSRKFLIYEDLAQVSLGVYPSQNVENIMRYQNIQFEITPIGFQIRNPNTDLSVLLLQNHQWNSAIFAPPPQYTSGNTYVYRYDEPTQFEGGNEYLYFDTKEIASSTPNISYVVKNVLYQHYLYIDAPRTGLPYTFFPDINGNFFIETLQGTDPAIEADYSEVYFSLAKQYSLDNEAIYIYGNFNNYQLTEENKMIYNPSLELYEGILLLKQGFYNYKYVTKKNDNVLKNNLSDSHAMTENRYIILVYHRPVGQLYDALIGQGTTQSFSLRK